MQGLKELAERYLGVSPAGPGQGTDWEWSYRTPWPDGWPGGLALVVGALLVGYVCWIYLREAVGVSLWKRLGLSALRLATLALLLFFLTELTLTVDRTGLPFVVVLIDDSASMTLEDQYKDPQLDEAVKKYLADIKAEDEPIRLNLAKSVLTRDNGEFLRELLQGHKLRVYRFSDAPALLGENEYLDEDELEELIPLIQGLKGDGDQTRPGPAIRKVLKDLRGTTPSAILVISDGITSTRDTDSLTSVAPLAVSQLVPIFTLGIGSEEPARDIHLYDLRVDEVAFVDDPILFSATVKAFGFPGRQVRLNLKDQATGKILESKEITLGADGRPLPVEIAYTPTIEGEYDFVVEIQPLAEETDPENNSETRRVSVRREKIRVLLAESAPRYEFRYLKNLLERDQTVTLHTVLLDADIEYADQDQSAKPLQGRFPVGRDSLFEYDVIVLGDVNRAELHTQVLQNLHDFVTERGGGLVFIAGELYNPLSYQGSLLEELLPIKLDGADLPRAETITQGFQPQLTIQGRKATSIFRFDDSELESLKIWNQLPELYWYLRAPELKETAVTLAEHPTATGRDGHLPIIVKREAGKGVVFFHATDELWRWRFRVGDEYYRRYWVQTIRYLTLSRLLGKTHSAVLESDRREYQRGETARLSVRFLDQRRVPDDKQGVRVIVERQGDFQRSIALAQLPDAPTVFEGVFDETLEGTYHAWVVSPAFPDSPPSLNFRVTAPAQELRKRSLDRSELTRTAQATRGNFHTLETAHRIPADLPPGDPVKLGLANSIPVWNRWELLGLFALLISAEWLLRKRSQLV